MMRLCGLLGVAVLVPGLAAAQVLTGSAAYGDWRGDRPGVTRRITADDLPAPGTTRSAGNGPSVLRRREGQSPAVPPGFTATLFAEGLDGPRLLRTAPNGDVFVAETGAGRITVFRGGGARPERFATGLDGPFGMAFYPPGPNPTFLYVATENQVLRFPYRAGDLKAAGPAQTVVAELAGSTGGHSTRDVAFTGDGRMLVSVGSQSNVATSMSRRGPAEIAAWEGTHGLGAAWGGEADRAAVLSFMPDGGDRRPFAQGVRNCVGLVVQPGTGEPWCATNERDGLGDDVPPDYVTRVRAGAFFGWPWWYIGGHEDPRHRGERPDLAGQAAMPDVLIQPHSAPLQMMFYSARPGPGGFPAEYDGDAFVALHGSWNRAVRTGYKLVRVHLVHGVPDGSYQDFLTGFVSGDGAVWGRPVGVTEAADGSLLVSEDGNDAIWRIAWTGGR